MDQKGVARRRLKWATGCEKNWKTHSEMAGRWREWFIWAQRGQMDVQNKEQSKWTSVVLKAH